MELCKKSELLEVPCERLSINVVISTEVYRVLKLCISNRFLRVIVAGLDDYTHVCLCYSEDLLVILLATGPWNDAERDAHIVPSISKDCLVCRDVDRFDDVSGLGAGREGKVNAFSQLARGRVVSVDLDAVERIKEVGLGA